MDKSRESDNIGHNTQNEDKATKNTHNTT